MRAVGDGGRAEDEASGGATERLYSGRQRAPGDAGPSDGGRSADSGACGLWGRTVVGWVGDRGRRGAQGKGRGVTGERFAGGCSLGRVPWRSRARSPATVSVFGGAGFGQIENSFLGRFWYGCRLERKIDGS